MKQYKYREVIKKVRKAKLLEKDLSKGDVIYFSGGNSFYLNYWMKKVDFKKTMLKLFEKGKVYAGSSAGAVVAGSLITPMEFLDHPEETPERIDEGLGFVDYSILPHWGYEKYKADYKRVMEKYGNDERFKLIKLTNKEAIAY